MNTLRFRQGNAGLGAGWWSGLFFAITLLLPATGTAQNLFSNLVFSVGTTVHDNTGRDWSYVLVGSPQPGLLAGRRFAVYAKAGRPPDAGAFTQRGQISAAGDAATVDGLLNKSVFLGQDLSGLNHSLEVLLHSIAGITNQTLAQKVVTALERSRVDPSVAQVVALLSRVNPGLTLCLGQGFAEPIAGVTTYEIREVNPTTGAAGDVAGRVTINPGFPVTLPAPGKPFQVVTNAPSDHLKIRLRWGSPDELRRLSLLSFGYNLWRIPLADAVAAGYDINPPGLSALQNSGKFTQVNPAPVTAGKDFSAGAGPGAADDPADATTYFFSDDNGFSHGGTAFADGAQFYYFVTARDVLGRDGFVSAGGLAQACRRRPPLAPTGAKVLNNVQVLPLAAGGVTNQQRFQITWQQNVDRTNLITHYWIYRWQNPAGALRNVVDPTANRVGIVPDVAGTNTGVFLDNGPDSPATAGVSNYWYTVRAVSVGACDPLLSPHSAPAWGVLRERAAPAAATGAIFGSCGTPVVQFQAVNNLTNPPDANNWNFRFTCQRRDLGVAWVQFSVTNSGLYVGTYGPFYFAPGATSAQMDFSVRVEGAAPSYDLGCVVGTFTGLTSAPVTAGITTAVPSGQRREYVFYCGQILETALSANDPLLTTLNGGISCYYAINPTPDPSGTVGMKFPVPTGTPMLVEIMTSNTVWTSYGVVWPDPNQMYWVSYPACILGPLPPIRGCVMKLPHLPDCEQHVARAADNGPVAPINVQFGLTLRTREYRLYRSVNGGPLLLMAQSAAPFDPANPTKQIVCKDDAMPSAAAQLCYFVQLLDEHGNGSPMSFLGCKPLAPSPPPRPVLAQPTEAGDLSHPQVRLNWFCPTSGVARFQVMVARNDGKKNVFVADKLLSDVVTWNSHASFLGLVPGLGSGKSSSYDAAQLTPPIGPGFGPGPQFSLTVGVEPNVAYRITVASVDAQGKPWEPSPEWQFTWKPPVQLPTVPWPARPLPDITAFDNPAPDSLPPIYPRVAAVLMYYYDAQSFQRLDRHYPVGVRFAELARSLGPTTTVGTTNQIQYTLGPQPSDAPLIDPNGFVFKRLSTDPARQNQPLLPIVLYRQQVANAAFPRVSGNVVQVSPLLESIPWHQQGTLPNAVFITIPDKLITVNYETANDQTRTFFYLRDQQPVVAGARYRYFVLRMDDHREIVETINAGEVEIPAQ